MFTQKIQLTPQQLDTLTRLAAEHDGSKIIIEHTKVPNSHEHIYITFKRRTEIYSYHVSKAGKAQFLVTN